MSARKIELKVKIMSLAAEARIIRTEERRAKAAARSCEAWLRARADGELHLGTLEDSLAPAAHRATFLSLQAHRTGVVRTTAREALLAYAFLRGKPYAEVEPPGSSMPNWDAVRAVVQRFGGDMLGWSLWLAAAKAHQHVPTDARAVQQEVSDATAP